MWKTAPDRRSIRAPARAVRSDALRSSSSGAMSDGPSGGCGASCYRQVQGRASEDRLDHRDHVRGVGDRSGALFEKPVGAFASRIERRTGHREDLAALFAGEPRGDQRARNDAPPPRPRRRAKDPRSADCGAGNRERAVPRRTAFPKSPRPGYQNFFQQFDVLGADRCDRDRRRARRWCRSRGWRDGPRHRCRVPAPTRWQNLRRRGRARCVRRISRRPPKRCASRQSRSSGRANAAEFAAHRDNRRRIVDHLQARRILGFAKREDIRRLARVRPSVRASASSREHMSAVTRRAATARETGQSGQRRRERRRNN